MPLLGAIIIGQAPRPDLVNPLRKANSLYQFVEVGALDMMIQMPSPLTHVVIIC